MENIDQQDRLNLPEDNNQTIYNEPSDSEYDNISELPLGDVISVDNSYFITAKENSKFIVLMGPSGSGKTSLVTAIYQLFQNGPIDRYYFAGSETLLAFEQRVYWTRRQSRQLNPDTPKTRRGVRDLLHLRICDPFTDEYSNLLIADFSGEDFMSVIANTEYALSDFDVIKGAWNVSIILDGELISEKDKRQSALKDAVELFRTFVDSDLFGKYVQIDVIISKYDIVKEKYTSDPTLETFEDYIKLQFNTIAKRINKRINYKYVTVMADNEVELDVDQLLTNIFKGFIFDDRINMFKVLQEHRNLVSQANCYAERTKVTI